MMHVKVKLGDLSKMINDARNKIKDSRFAHVHSKEAEDSMNSIDEMAYAECFDNDEIILVDTRVYMHIYKCSKMQIF